MIFCYYVSENMTTKWVRIGEWGGGGGSFIDHVDLQHMKSQEVDISYLG